MLTVGKEGAARQVVVLGQPAGVRDIPEFSQPSRPDMLPREMVRQAVLIAAREELGLATRDEVIDETPADSKDAGANSVEVVSYIRDNRSHEIILRLENAQTETLMAHETPTTPGRDLDLIKLLASAELLSREEFPKVLKGLGLAGKPNTIKEEAELPTKVDDRLTSLDFLDVLLAVRDVHGAMKSDGESPSRSGALVRGYALLGVLSEFHWHPAHKAFKGRALLYAQRMIARSPDRPWSLWNRAFALALVGRHRDALADLDLAKKKMASKDSSSTPDWVDVIDAFSRFQPTRLTRVQGPQKKLAALLRMLTLAFPRTTSAGLHAANDVVDMEPYCFRAHDGMSEFFGVSIQHVTTVIGPQGLDHFISKRIPATEDLPANVKVLPSDSRHERASSCPPRQGRSARERCRRASLECFGAHDPRDTICADFSPPLLLQVHAVHQRTKSGTKSARTLPIIVTSRISRQSPCPEGMQSRALKNLRMGSTLSTSKRRNRR